MREFSHWITLCAHKKKVLERGLFGRERTVLLEPHLPERVNVVSMAKCDVDQSPRAALAQGRLPEISYVEETEPVEIYNRLKSMNFNALSYRPIRVNVNQNVVEETGEPGVLVLERDSYKPSRQDYWRTRSFINDLMASHSIERRVWHDLIRDMEDELKDVMKLMVKSEKMSVEDMQDLYLKQKGAISAQKTLPQLLTAIERAKAAGGKAEDVIKAQVKQIFETQAIGQLELYKDLHETEEWQKAEGEVKKSRKQFEKLMSELKGEEEEE